MDHSDCQEKNHFLKNGLLPQARLWNEENPERVVKLISCLKEDQKNGQTRPGTFGQYKLRSYGFQNSGSTAMIRVFVETPNGRDSAGFTVPESAAADDVLMALRSRGWSPFALRFDLEQQAWIALDLDWRRAA